MSQNLVPTRMEPAVLRWLFGGGLLPTGDKPATKRGGIGVAAAGGCVLKPIIPVVRRIISIEPTKKKDELITISSGSDEDLGPYSSGGIVEQFIRRDFGKWFYYPNLEKVGGGSWVPLENMHESFLLRQDYATEPPLAVAIKSRKSAVKCIYCHSELEHRAQVCLHCGGFLCLECAPTQEKCPTLGCQ